MNIVLPGFDLAESIWSQGSDLTLDDLALESDSASSPTRSSASTRWSAEPSTPSISHHSELPPALASAPEVAAAPQPAPLRVETSRQTLKSTEPDSPAPAYSRDPLEFDPVLLASLDPQLRLRPFDAFEDLCYASFNGLSPPEVSTQPPRPRSASLSLHRPSTPSASFTAQSSLSDTSMESIPALPPPQLLPTYSVSKPLPAIPPPSPQSSREPTRRERRSPPHPPVVMTFESFAPLMDASFPTAPPTDAVQFFPMRAPLRTRSKSVGGTRTVRRLTSAIARLRGRE